MLYRDQRLHFFGHTMSINLCLLIIVQTANFPYEFLPFAMIFDKILKFHDFSMTGKFVFIFRIFQVLWKPRLHLKEMTSVLIKIKHTEEEVI